MSYDFKKARRILVRRIGCTPRSGVPVPEDVSTKRHDPQESKCLTLNDRFEVFVRDTWVFQSPIVCR